MAEINGFHLCVQSIVWNICGSQISLQVTSSNKWSSVQMIDGVEECKLEGKEKGEGPSWEEW